MIDANTLEKGLLESLEKLIFQANFYEFAKFLRKLKRFRIRVLILLNPSENSCNLHLKKSKKDAKDFLTNKKDLIHLVKTEKLSAIRSQEFDYAVKVRDFENEIKKIPLSNALNKLDTIIDLSFKYSIAIHSQDVFITIKSKVHFLIYLESNIREINLEIRGAKIERLKEKVIKLSESNTALRNKLEKTYNVTDSLSKAHIVYASEILYFQPINDSYNIPKYSLKEHLMKIVSVDINVLTLLATYLPDIDEPLTPYIGENNPAIDSILSDSLGWLAYPHQLISLFSLATGINSKEIIARFVDDFNHNKHSDIDVYLSQPLLGSTLGEIIKERIFLKQVVLRHPNYYTAIKLNTYFNEE